MYVFFIFDKLYTPASHAWVRAPVFCAPIFSWEETVFAQPMSLLGLARSYATVFARLPQLSQGGKSQDLHLHVALSPRPLLRTEQCRKRMFSFSGLRVCGSKCVSPSTTSSLCSLRAVDSVD